MTYKQVIIVRNDLKMSKGKLCAQCGHAVIESFLKAKKKTPDAVEEWLNEGQEKIVLKVDSEKELLELFEKMKKLFPSSLIRDAGRTELQAGTKTCVGAGPAKEIELDKFTAGLKLL